MIERIEPVPGVLIYSVNDSVFIIVRKSGISIDSSDKNTLDTTACAEVVMSVWMGQIQLRSILKDGVFINQEEVSQEIKGYTQ